MKIRQCRMLKTVMICSVLLLFAGPSLGGTTPAPAGGKTAEDLSDLEVTLQGFTEPRELARPLAENGVVLSADSGARNIYALYADYRTNLQPVFITTDLLFHTLHKVFERSLKAVELEQLPLLTRFSSEMYNAAMAMAAASETDEALIPALRQLAAYFAVPAVLMGADIALPADLSERVGEEIALIRAHEGFAFSKVLPQKEDFSQYAVRGHYAKHDALERYFPAAMWYGRRMFRFDETTPEGAGGPLDTPSLKGWWGKTGTDTFPEIARNEILSACLLVHLLEHHEIDGQPAMAVYRALKAPLDLLVGTTDDMEAAGLSKALRSAYGEDWGPADLTDLDKLYAFAKTAATATGSPTIDNTGLGRKGLTLLGQRAIPDAAIFRQLVHSRTHPLPYTGTAADKPFTWAKDGVFGEVRGFPRGLDLMAVLGSATAETLLAENGDAAYNHYPARLAALKQKMAGFSPGPNAFEWMLSAFTPIFNVPEPAPAFMRSAVWDRKCLNTALGAWTELRHDTVLYGKQSYTPVPRGGRYAELPLAYLEPNPEAFRRMAGVVALLKTDDRLTVPDYLRKAYGDLADILDRLATIAEAELAGAPPFGEDAQFLAGVSGKLETAIRLPEAAAQALNIGKDGDMALAADVHTRMPEVLTVAVGFPGKIIVLMDINGKPALFFGGVYTYYEFKAPYGDRLTDEKWRKRLETDSPSAVPLLF